MRTNEERIAAMHQRAVEVKREQRGRRVRIVQTVSAAASFACVVLLAMFMPHLDSSGSGADAMPAANMNASIFGQSVALSYIVIAIIAFFLGTFATVFCFYLRKWQKLKEEEDIL